ncbi:MAG: aldo/keto reductase [Clostridium cadaveris]|uniref:Aldo/keto reductase n=1 Tax=Clostridium cadaveris TaxID=1529 RepID=A0A1I2MY65_9CLOT|nr:aldo/keto reductase [Clostridium cadaveris]MDU4951093.1 aldo/keto reductase [Clostridium sp.]MDM8313607.1 aldo/keto reductase [Clostridium cadaveris]MDY4948341.1 aldo/keto reductase [Clostridium cadaveris]NME65014.1 aldo/keto reductase [Clostridium cadaveris]NWK10438.1 aldo/keto reductase [Clostridium cadaveris]
MLYRNYGKTNEKVSTLGFGLMRLPLSDGKIDRSKSSELLDYAISRGLNYLDTAYPYHNGESEEFLGEYLKSRNIREKVFIATKLPSFLIKTRDDFEKYFNEQMKKLQLDYVDFYLVHALNKEYFENVKSLGVFEFLDSLKAQGKIKHVGFSFHDKLEVFKEIVDSYPWEFCQIQYNILDANYQAGEEGLKYATDRGLGLAVMEPLRGGRLASNVPKDIKELWDSAEVKRTPAQWAFKYLWNNENVDVVLSGMNDFDQIKDNIDTAETTDANSLSHSETELIEKVKEKYISKIKVNCTACRYCMPCPMGVNIPKAFDYLNNASLFDDLSTFKENYIKSLKDKESPVNCIKCGKCETICPQHIEIRKSLEETISVFNL